MNRCNAIVASALLKSLIDFPRDQGGAPLMEWRMSERSKIGALVTYVLQPPYRAQLHAELGWHRLWRSASYLATTQKASRSRNRAIEIMLEKMQELSRLARPDSEAATRPFIFVRTVICEECGGPLGENLECSNCRLDFFNSSRA